MNSYTITDLSPSTHYMLRLYLRRNLTMVEVSRLVATTQDPDYIKEHGIRKNYGAIVFIGEHITYYKIFWLYAQNIQCKHLICYTQSTHSLLNSSQYQNI